MSIYSIFGTKILPKFTNDFKNVLKVSSKKEIFFDVFECKLNGKNIVVEKTGQYENTPIVRFEIKNNGNVFNCEALLVIDKENDLYLNENNLEFSKNIKVPIVEKTIVKEVKKIVPTDTLHVEKIQNISDKIVAESEEKARLIQEAKLKEYELKQEQIIEQSENYLNGKFDNYIKENIHTLVTDSNLVYDKLVENLNNLNDGEIKDILGERIKSINEELNHQLKNEVTSMKRYVEMSSGGGSVAKQFANGGTMNGDLNVTGELKADTILATTLLSAGTMDINFELSGFSVTGDISASGSITGSSLKVSDINTVPGNNLNIGATSGPGGGGSVIITSQNIGINSDTLLLNGERLQIGSGNAAAIKINSTFTGTDNIFLVDATTDRVGINQASPAEELDVVGNIKASGSITGANLVAAAAGIKFSDYTSTSIGTVTTPVDPNQNNIPAVGAGNDTTTDLAVDQTGNVVRTTQEATWTLTEAQINALTTNASGVELIEAPGANKFVIIEKATFLINYAYNGSSMSTAQQYHINQDGNVSDVIAVLNGTRINNITKDGQSSGAGNSDTYGIYEHDTGFATLNRTYKPNKATTLKRLNTAAIATAVTSMTIKIRYRVYDVESF